MTRASKAEVRRHARDVRDTLAHLERCLRADNFDHVVGHAAKLFEQARTVEYAARALARSKAAAAARRDRAGAR